MLEFDKKDDSACAADFRSRHVYESYQNATRGHKMEQKQKRIPVQTA